MRIYRYKKNFLGLKCLLSRQMKNARKKIKKNKIFYLTLIIKNAKLVLCSKFK